MNSRNFFGITTIVIGLFLMILQVESKSDNCGSPKCIQEAARILDYIDTKANPCDNFYQFSCGTFLKNALGEKKHTVWGEMEGRTIREKFEIVQEDINQDDHKILKAVKKLYRACLKERRIVDAFLKTAYKIVETVGGWPVADGDRWNENNFDWLNATYELRRLGFEFSQFLNLDVYKISENKAIYRLSQTIHEEAIEDLIDIVKVARWFGALNEELVSQEYTKAYKSVSDINQDTDSYSSNQTIEDIQKSDGVIDWLQFLTNIAGSKIEIDQTTSIDFPQSQQIKKRLELLKKVSKRDQANYMIWNVLKPLYRYVKDTESFRNHDLYSHGQNREEYCLDVASKAYSTSVMNPIDVIRLRRNLPKNKKDKMEQTISFVTSTMKDVIKQLVWMPENSKGQFLKKMEETDVVVEMTEDYFDDKILNDAAVDMMDLEEDATFFDLLGQANRNMQTLKYKHMIPKYVPLYLTKGGGHAITSDSDHLYLPVVASELFYNENRPEYLNHAALGFIISKMLSERIWKYMPNEESEIKNCIISGINNSVLSDMDKKLVAHEAIRLGFSEKIARTVYEKWTTQNGEEPKLVANEYTPNQLFWISLASLACSPEDGSNYYWMINKVARYESDSNILTESLRLNSNFAKDFNCPVDSKVNPSNRCKTF